MTGLTSMEQQEIITKTSIRMYDLTRAELFAEYDNCVQFYVPKTAECEAVLKAMFERSNHFLQRAVHRWRASGNELSFFCFRRAKVIIEKYSDKDYVYIVMPKKISAKFKMMVFRKLFALHDQTKGVVRLVKTWYDMQTLSIGWRVYCEEDRTEAFNTWYKDNLRQFQQEIPK